MSTSSSNKNLQFARLRSHPTLLILSIYPILAISRLCFTRLCFLPWILLITLGKSGNMLRGPSFIWIIWLAWFHFVWLMKMHLTHLQWAMDVTLYAGPKWVRLLPMQVHPAELTSWLPMVKYLLRWCSILIKFWKQNLPSIVTFVEQQQLMVVITA